MGRDCNGVACRWVGRLGGEMQAGWSRSEMGALVFDCLALSDVFVGNMI